MKIIDTSQKKPKKTPGMQYTIYWHFELPYLYPILVHQQIVSYFYSYNISYFYQSNISKLLKVSCNNLIEHVPAFWVSDDPVKFADGRPNTLRSPLFFAHQKSRSHIYTSCFRIELIYFPLVQYALR